MFDFTKIQQKKLQEIAVRTPTIRPFIEDTPGKKAERVEKATGDGWKAFKFMCTTYLPHIFTLPFCPDHREEFELTESNTKGITVDTGFRGFGKTMRMGPAYQIWKLIKGEDYVLLIAADREIASERTSFIYNELTNNRRILNDYPELKIIDGDEEDFYLKNKARIRSRSIKQGIKGTINPKTGKRPGLIDCDDIDKSDNIGNWVIGKRKLDKILGESLGALDPSKNGRVTWKGNLTHPNFAICQMEDEIAEEIKSDDPKAKPAERKHLISGKKILMRFPIEKADGTSRWPEQFPTEELATLRKTMGNVNYLREMMGKKIIEGKVFKWEWFKRWNKLPQQKARHARLYVDPAYGEKNCRKAYVGGIKFENKYYVTHCRDRQEKDSVFFESFYRTFEELKKKHGVRLKVRVEGNYAQCKRFCRDLDIWCNNNNNSSITHFIKPYYNKENKLERCESLETIVEQGLIIYPDGQDTKTIEEEFLSFPDGFLDGIDATEGWLQQFPGFNPRRGRARARRV